VFLRNTQKIYYFILCRFSLFAYQNVSFLETAIRQEFWGYVRVFHRTFSCEKTVVKFRFYLWSPEDPQWSPEDPQWSPEDPQWSPEDPQWSPEAVLP